MTTLRLLALTADTIRFSYTFCITFTTTLIRVSVALYVLGQMAGERWFAWHAAWTQIDSIQWGESISCMPKAYEYAPPAISPLWVVAEGMSEMSCNTIRRTTGLRLRTSKIKLIAAALAY